MRRIKVSEVEPLRVEVEAGGGYGQYLAEVRVICAVRNSRNEARMTVSASYGADDVVRPPDRHHWSVDGDARVSWDGERLIESEVVRWLTPRWEGLRERLLEGARDASLLQDGENRKLALKHFRDRCEESVRLVDPQRLRAALSAAWTAEDAAQLTLLSIRSWIRERGSLVNPEELYEILDSVIAESVMEG